MLHALNKQTKLLMTFFISKSTLLKKKIRSISKEGVDKFFGFKKKKPDLYLKKIQTNFLFKKKKVQICI